VWLSYFSTYPQNAASGEKFSCQSQRWGAFYFLNQNPLYPHGAMIPTNAIATGERPLSFRPAAGGCAISGMRASLCYESFTLNALSSIGVPRIFARVMNAPQTHVTHPKRWWFSPWRVRFAQQFRLAAISAHNLLRQSLDIRHFPSAIRPLNSAIRHFPSAI
jgi:hypothetical protein